MQIDQAMQNLERLETFYFIPDLRSRQQSVWYDAEHVSPRDTASKFPTYHHWFAVPRGYNNENSKSPFSLPYYLTLDLPRHVSRHVSCFRLRSHRLRVESVHWQDQGVHCDCGCNEVQDEKHVLFYCRYPAVCSLRDKYFDLFERGFLGSVFRSNSAGRNLYLDASCVIQDWQVSRFMHQQNYRAYRFISELFHIFL